MTNPNQSRVLNFVFRQLLQEYVTIMYLSNVKIGFSNGHPESQVIVPIEKLDELLETYVKPVVLVLAAAAAAFIFANSFKV